MSQRNTAAAISPEITPFQQTLAAHGLELTRTETTTLQINVGLLCNQTCRHCHLEAGPTRPEVMDRRTVDQVIDLAKRVRFKTIDLTGGAPEMNPHIDDLLQGLAPHTDTLILRSNLTAIHAQHRDDLINRCRDLRVTIVASFPSLNEAQAEAQRGRGIFQQSLATLGKLNDAGYGQVDSGLELNLVANPTGAFLSPDQHEVELRFRQVLAAKWGITFNNLFAFANMPLGRFRHWLEQSGNFEPYMTTLAAGFNPCAVAGLMCRSLLSVSWEGFLFDCDFNQAIGLRSAGQAKHISELTALPAIGTPIAVSNHCYTCTAGAGFT